MLHLSPVLRVASVWLCFAGITSGVQAQDLKKDGFPRTVRFSSVLKDMQGKPRVGIHGVVFSIYEKEHGGAPVWTETQNVEADSEGNYNVLLGSTTSEGMPGFLFSENEAQWLGVWVQLPEEVEQPRQRLETVPYALKAADAELLGGRPASDYALRENSGSIGAGSATSPSRVLFPGGGLTGVVAGPGLTGGGYWGTVTLGLDTAFTDSRYPRLTGPTGQDLTIDGLQLTGRLNDTFFVGTTGGHVTPPALGPLVIVEATDGGNISNGTYHFKVTLVNLNGETTPSPATPITLSTCTGTGCILTVAVRGLEWRTGAFGFRIYASADGVNFFLQAARPIRRLISTGSIQRVSNLVTVNFALPTTGYTIGDTATVSGASGCLISPNGNFKITNVNGLAFPLGASFRYQQQGPDETCGDGVSSVRTDFDVGPMTNVHLVRGDFLLEDIVTVGSQPPSTNQAAIDDVQVAVNRACPYASNRCDGAVALDNGNDPPNTVNSIYKLTTPLILSSGAVIRGMGSVDVALAQLQGTQVSCTPAANPLWGSENIGCIMVINALGITISGVNVVSHSHGVMLFHSNMDSAAGNNIEIGDGTIHTRGTAAVSPLRIKGRFYYVRFNQLILVANTTVDTAPVRGAAVMISNPAGGNWHWTGPVRWMIPTKHDGVQNRKGPTDPDRGANVHGFPAMATVVLRDIQMQYTGGGGTGVPCRCENVNLKLENVNWADYAPDPGTDGLIQLGMDRDGQGSPFSIEIDDSGLGGHPNAAATIQVTENGLSNGLVQITNSGILGSGPASVAIDANNKDLKLSINGGAGLDCDPNATRHLIANLPSTVHANLTCVNSGNMATTESRRTNHVFMGGVLFRGHRATSLEWLHWQDNTDNLDWWRGNPAAWSNRRATFGSSFTRLYQSDGLAVLADFNRATNLVSFLNATPLMNGGPLGTPSLRWAGTFTTVDLSSTLTSTVPVGISPFTVTSTTEVANLNVQKWHGRDALDFTHSLNFGTINPLSCVQLPLSVPGAVVGSPVIPGWPILDLDLSGMMIVTAPDQVSVRLCNLSAQATITMSQSGVFSGRVIR